MLKGKNVVVGVCGGIAAYKVCDVVSRLRKISCDVKVIMTKSACEFVSSMTFRTLSQNEVVTDMFEEPGEWDVKHISLAKSADLFVIAPATANFIGKVANGIADDMLTTTVMATKKKVLIVPAMNTEMYTNPIVQENIEKLKKLGYMFMEPGVGLLACGDKGKGRLPDPEKIVENIKGILYPKKDMAGKKVLITAGPTREAMDPVRFISNNSTGKMGINIAKVSYLRGADVTLVLGPTAEKIDFLCNLVNVVSASEMYDAVINNVKDKDIIIMSAAVSDYSPKDVNCEKIKSSYDSLTLFLEKNKDILKSASTLKDENAVIGGFSMETENMEENSVKKMKEKNIDFIVANNLKQKGAGFSVDTNIVTIFDKNGNKEEYPIMSKFDVANNVIDKALSFTENYQN